MGGADADEVLAALPDHLPDLHDVVFLADADTMCDEQNSLLAVSTDPDMRDEDHEIPGLGFTNRFRGVPAFRRLAFLVFRPRGSGAVTWRRRTGDSHVTDYRIRFRYWIRRPPSAAPR